MEVIVLPSESAAAEKVASLIERQVQENPQSVLGLATGGTPEKVYELLVKQSEVGKFDLSEATCFNLDEYVGLDREHKASYAYYMQSHLFSKVPCEKKFIPNGMAPDIEQECAAYELQIEKSGGIDLQLLGIGSDGHIGFNEPSSSLRSRTRIKTLTETTRKDNQVYFEEGQEPPVHVITMGIGTIMDCRRILLMATGEKKASAVAGMIEGPITAMLPASVLQFHEKATIVLDEAAASQLKRTDYYRWVYKYKPTWQT